MSEKSSGNTKLVLVLVAGLIVGFVAGFVFANRVNREEEERLRGELARARSTGGAQNDSGQTQGSRTQGASGPQRASAGGAGADDEGEFPTLTDEQLKNAVARADASPADVETQKKAGQALYYYALQKGNAAILPDVARILKRAHELDAKDYKITVLAGDAYFLVARNGGDSGRLEDARKLYEAALASKPDDVVVRTSLGLTYFYGKPPDARRAFSRATRSARGSSLHRL